MPRSPEDNEIIRTARRDQILRAAGRVFAKKGLAATKIADIAAEAGLSHGLLYHYFRSKAAVYSALLDEIMLKKPAGAAGVRAARPGMARLEDTVRLWLEQVADRPEFSVLVAQAFLAETLPPATRQAFLRFARAGYRELVADIEAAQRSGVATKDAPATELAVAIIALIRGLALVRLVAVGESARRASLSYETVLRVIRFETPTSGRLERPGVRPESGARAMPRKRASSKNEGDGSARP